MALGVLVFIAGAVLVQYCVAGPNGDLIGGWSLAPEQLRIGFTRLMFPFFAGLLLSRIAKPGRVKHAFLLSSLLVAAVLGMPRIGGEHDLWMNGLYESLCIIFVFPLVVWLGASGQVKAGLESRVCEFLGGISYPLYIVHYPFIYAYTAWVADNKLSVQAAWPVALSTLACTVALSWIFLKFYDISVRRWLSRRVKAKAAQKSASPAVEA